MGDEPAGLSFERRMPGPVRPPYGELEEVLRRALADGSDLDGVRRLAEEVADDEDLDLRRALDRAERLWEDRYGDG